MLRVLKWIGIVLGSLVGVLVLALVVLFFMGGAPLNKTFDVQAAPVAIPSDAASIERGRHLAEAVVGCTGCHNDNLAGQNIFDDSAVGALYAPNITSGQGGVGAAYTNADWARAIRHGVGPEGKGFLIMPSEAHFYLTDEDLGAVIAYVKSVPPVDNELPGPAFTPLGRVLVAIGALGELLAADKIDHTTPPPAAPDPGVTAEYGGYLVSIAGCAVCHGEDLSGAQSPAPDAPPAPNLTPGGHLAGWSQAEFFNALRTGVTPGGGQLDPEAMPWESFHKMTDDELAALWLYLQSLVAVTSEG